MTKYADMELFERLHLGGCNPKIGNEGFFVEPGDWLTRASVKSSGYVVLHKEVDWELGLAFPSSPEAEKRLKDQGYIEEPAAIVNKNDD